MFWERVDISVVYRHVIEKKRGHVRTMFKQRGHFSLICDHVFATWVKMPHVIKQCQRMLIGIFNVSPIGTCYENMSKFY